MAINFCSYVRVLVVSWSFAWRTHCNLLLGTCDDVGSRSASGRNLDRLPRRRRKPARRGASAFGTWGRLARFRAGSLNRGQLFERPLQTLPRTRRRSASAVLILQICHALTGLPVQCDCMRHFFPKQSSCGRFSGVSRSVWLGDFGRVTQDLLRINWWHWG